MSEGGFIYLKTDINDNVIGWFRADFQQEGAAYHYNNNTPLKFLKVINNIVVEMSQEEKDAVLLKETQEAEERLAEAQLEAERLANLPFEINKVKLSDKFKSIGKLEYFMNFVESNRELNWYWNASRVLDSNNPLVVAAMESVAGILPEGYTVRDLILQCKE